MKTQDRIQETALELFNQHGIGAVGVRDIARALEISPGNMSYHYPRKEDLVVAIMASYTAVNDTYYETYFKGPPNLGAYLGTLEKIFRNQFRHRGIFLGQEWLRQIMSRHYDYGQTDAKRQAAIREILAGLQAGKEILATEPDLEFLLHHIGFFGRFWMLEAFFNHSRDLQQEEILRHYLRQMAYQFSLFATEKGKTSINLFLQDFDSRHAQGNHHDQTTQRG